MTGFTASLLLFTLLASVVTWLKDKSDRAREQNIKVKLLQNIAAYLCETNEAVQERWSDFETYISIKS